ncbi:proton-conducting transporter membrane subunit [Halohasta salina]|uniref:proton-conducting transporter transmembrane domain-containing protein n=1 Tax=Halohasta salina TaxID=2961621 RepID=UPI0020A58273|nr:proton-conducting transporter membrane subunit [Halohasta salina]
MTDQDQLTTIGSLPNGTPATGSLPAVLTRLVWLLWVATLGVAGLRLSTDASWSLAGVVSVDGLTVVMWVAVTFFSGIVHSYSRRYLAAHDRADRFFATVFGFTLVVMVLVAADHIALFALAWVAMGLAMAELIGHVKGWPQARAAGSLARRYFLASGGLLVVALAVLWSATDATTVSGIGAAADTVPQTLWFVAAGALLLAAMIQSALVPFHTWLLASMTAPTPASALMHAGFVNAGGVLLVRFGPVISVDAGFMLLVVAVGATSALLGKLLKSVQPDIKSQLGCSTVGQMGFMIMQAGLGFFGAAITHLVLHGFYKAYQFLSSGDAVAQTSPTKGPSKPRSLTAVGFVVTVLTALAGGVLFAVLTGKGTSLDTGVLLALLVVLTTLHATRTALARTSVAASTRYALIPLVFLPAIAIYAASYNAITGVIGESLLVSAPAELTVVHGLVAAAFVVAYAAIETGLYQHSQRLYVALLNATQPPSSTVMTSAEDYNEY